MSGKVDFKTKNTDKDKTGSFEKNCEEIIILKFYGHDNRSENTWRSW